MGEQYQYQHQYQYQYQYQCVSISLFLFLLFNLDGVAFLDFVSVCNRCNLDTHCIQTLYVQTWSKCIAHV